MHNKLCAKDKVSFLYHYVCHAELVVPLAQLLFRVLKVYLIVVCQVCCYLQLWSMFRLGTIKVFKHYLLRLDILIVCEYFVFEVLIWPVPSSNLTSWFIWTPCKEVF